MPGAHTLRIGAGDVCGANRASVAAVSRKSHSMRGPDLCAIRTENGPNGGVVEKPLRAVIRLGAVDFGLGASGKVRGLPWERAGGAGEAI